MIKSFSTKPVRISGGEDYDWVESDDIATLIRTRSLVAQQVAQHKMLLKVVDSDGTSHLGVEALNLIPMLAVKYNLPSGKTVIHAVTPKKELGYNAVASCIESLKMWRVVHQRDTEDGMITNPAYFDGHSEDWKPALLPEAVSA